MMTENTNKLIAAVNQLAMESRVRASMLQSDYRRGNISGCDGPDSRPIALPAFPPI